MAELIFFFFSAVDRDFVYANSSLGNWIRGGKLLSSWFRKD